MVNEFNFLHPRSHYYGEVKPENLVFNANLQEFATSKILVGQAGVVKTRTGAIDR